MVFHPEGWALKWAPQGSCHSTKVTELKCFVGHMVGLFGLFCAGSGIGLSDPDGPFPIQDIYDYRATHKHIKSLLGGSRQLWLQELIINKLVIFQRIKSIHMPKIMT